ncbi:MAG: radical SAM protein [Prevotellaceae bacterium]|jgi:radical SAM superfamily enzyme YgiQ (UPF0313 family)|nr:radical SAM protein [Prevotellaceae bacterium]
MSDKILFNWVPPAACERPSPSGSILKSFLQKHEIIMDIKYWNLTFMNFQNEFIGSNINYIEDFSITLLPFLNYISIYSNDKESYNNIKYKILSIRPQWNNMGKIFIDKQMSDYAYKLDEIIESEIKKIDIARYLLFGVSSKLSQWIPANIICKKIKNQYPQLPIIIGGFGTKDEAIAIMNNFGFYDYAIWGEGEYPLLELYHSIQEDDKREIPYLVYRDIEKNPCVFSSKKKQFLNMNENVYPDFDDFFQQNLKENAKVSLPIEGSRGCHWNQCRFCYLNDGYQYRVKNTDSKIQELKYQIKKHNISSFVFLDNDVIGKSIENFNIFLDKLIELREEHEKFVIELAEIVTKGINYEIIKKMALAGFQHVQIGYESPSNELLKKIHKKNTFASNLFFIKWARHFSIHIGGLNVLIGLLEETTENIMESIDNLHYMRFYLQKNYFNHNISQLAITKSSRYYKEIKDLNKWNIHLFSGLLPNNYIDKDDLFNVFQFIESQQNLLWYHFIKVEKHYSTNLYEYDIIRYSNTIYYREFYNKSLINEIEFDDSLYWDILSLLNYKVLSINDIQNHLQIDNNSKLYVVIDSLFDEGLVYKTEDYSEIVSLINTDKLQS